MKRVFSAESTDEYPSNFTTTMAIAYVGFGRNTWYYIQIPFGKPTANKFGRIMRRFQKAGIVSEFYVYDRGYPHPKVLQEHLITPAELRDIILSRSTVYSACQDFMDAFGE